MTDRDLNKLNNMQSHTPRDSLGGGGYGCYVLSSSRCPDVLPQHRHFLASHEYWLLNGFLLNLKEVITTTNRRT